MTDSSLAGSLVLRVKYAFVELDNIKAARSWVRFGAHQTPWLDFEESINRYRVQGTMFSEREALIPGSSDFGVGYFTPARQSTSTFRRASTTAKGIRRRT